tara:strand:+ start:263 stop:1168 length:906 start_codon:yes stop_codon:yes gene_type:complete
MELSQPELLRKLLQTKDLVSVGGAFDAMSAKLVETANFDAVWAGSFAISATHALPDASIMTMTEFLNVAENMVESCKIPVIADCDTGFGGPTNVAHMVKKYENAGISAISIEDKVFPKQNSLLDDAKHELLSEKDFVSKIIAAHDARKNENFLIIARTEALIAEQGLDEALKRARAYENAGADAILIHSKKSSPGEIIQFANSWDGNIPLVVVPTSYGSITKQELIKNKIKMVIYANQTLRAAHASMQKTLQEIKEQNNLDGITQDLSSMNDIFDLQETYDIKTKEEKYREKLKNLGYVNE